jgi:predicted nucleotidyltransferase
MDYNSTILAIDLVKDTYNLTDPFEIQSKIEEDLNMEMHINDILKHLKIKNYDKQRISRVRTL